MPLYQDIAWFPLCGGLTALGLVLSWLGLRRRGVRAGLRGVAWSLLPLAAYLTGTVEVIWKFATAIADFAWGTIFGIKGWAGIILAAVSLVLFAVTGGLRRRAVKQGKGTSHPKAAAAGAKPGKAVEAAKPAAGTPDDLADVSDILKRHGIR